MGFVKFLWGVIILFLLGYGFYRLFFWFKRKRSGAQLLDQADFQKNSRKAQIIDVREREEFNKGHILGARSVPYTVSRAHKEYLTAIRKDMPIYLYDNNESIVLYMATLLKKEGYTDIFVLRGGYSEWTGKTK